MVPGYQYSLVRLVPHMFGIADPVGLYPPPNTFGTNHGMLGTQTSGMSHEATVLAETDAPDDRPVETLDVRELGPPEPLQRTFELLADLPDETVLVQHNDRAPQFLYPKLEDRGYSYETVETDDVVTVVWREVDQ